MAFFNKRPWVLVRLGLEETVRLEVAEVGVWLNADFARRRKDLRHDARPANGRAWRNHR